MAQTAGGLTPDHLPDWYAQAASALTFPLGWKDGDDPALWRDRGRQAFQSLLLEDDSPLDPGPRIQAEETRGDYQVQRLSLQLGPFRRTSALLARPLGSGPFPAAVLLHDHGAFFAIGKEKMIRPLDGDPKATMAAEWMDKNYGGHSLGDDLAQRGWVVLAIDALGWGDRACADYESQQAVAANLLGLGSSWAGLILVEDLASAAYLASLPEVDRRRVVSIGHSMGSVRSWQLAALSDQVTAAVASCSFGTVAGQMIPGSNRVRGQSAFAMTHPGLVRLMDYPDVAALAAPKPLYMVHGSTDHLFSPAMVRAAYAQTAAVYEAWGQPSRFHAGWHPGGHVFPAAEQRAALDWVGARI